MAALVWLQSQRKADLADYVEKLRKSDIGIFQQTPIKPGSQMRPFLTGGELAHERREAPLASKIWLPCTANNFTELAKILSFSTKSAGSGRLLQVQTGLLKCETMVAQGKLKSRYLRLAEHYNCVMSWFANLI